MIRDAQKEDASKIAHINVIGWKTTYKNIFPDSFLNNIDENDEENIRKYMDKIDQYVVYEEEGKVLGFAKYGMNKKGYNNEYAEIYALYIDNDYKGRKIGTKLVKYIINKLKNKYRYLLISTLKENSANIFYQKIGGKIIGECNFILENKEYKENIYLFDINN